MRGWACYRPQGVAHLDCNRAWKSFKSPSFNLAYMESCFRGVLREAQQ